MNKPIKMTVQVRKNQKEEIKQFQVKDSFESDIRGMYFTNEGFTIEQYQGETVLHTLDGLYKCRIISIEREEPVAVLEKPEDMDFFDFLYGAE